MIGKELKILFVEDAKFDVILLKHEIEKNGIHFTDLTVDRKDTYVKALNEFKPDLILSDYSLPGFNGMTALSLRKELAPFVPFILITGAISEEIAVEVMKAGADDYIIKGNITRLGQAIFSALEKSETQKQKKDFEDQLRVLSRAVEQNPASVIIADICGIIEYVNPRFEKLTGYTKEDVLGKSIEIFKKDLNDPDLFRKIFKTLQLGSEWQDEFKSLKKTGEIYYESSRICPILDDEGEIVHYLVVSEDITEKKKALALLELYKTELEEMVRKRTDLLERRTVELERAKERAESADRLKSAFLANLSHELRTPLNSVIGFSSILLQGKAGEINQEQQKQLGMIRSSGVHLLSLISDILDLSTIEAGQLTINLSTFNIIELIEDVCHSLQHFAEEKGLNLNFNKNGDYKEIFSDRQRVYQIISNLVNNAVKFTEKGSVTVNCLFEDGMVSVKVQDTGIGIKEENLDKLFIPFIQLENNLVRKHPGSGLGLSISKKLAERLNGNITVKSRYGEGSIFTFYTPVKQVAEVNETSDSDQIIDFTI